MSLASAIRAAVSGTGRQTAAENPAPEDENKAEMPEEDKPAGTEPEEDKPAAAEPEDKKPDASEDPAVEPGEDDTAEKAKASERQRIGAITGHANADRLPSLAAHLAYKTGLSAKASGAILDAAALDAGAAKPGLAERMTGKVPPLGAAAHASESGSLAQAAAQKFGTRKAQTAQKGNSK